jgi:hypothetical protein
MFIRFLFFQRLFDDDLADHFVMSYTAKFIADDGEFTCGRWCEGKDVIVAG